LFSFLQTAAATADLLFFPDQPAAGEGRPLDASLGTADHREIARLVLDRLPGPVRLDGVAFQVGRPKYRDSLTRINIFGIKLNKTNSFFKFKMDFEIDIVLTFYLKPFSWFFHITQGPVRICLHLFYHWSGGILQSTCLTNALGNGRHKQIVPI
jgi:hypothetical protein